MKPISLGTMRTRAASYADLLSNQLNPANVFVPNATDNPSLVEWNWWINAELDALYDMLLQADPERYALQYYFSMTPGQQTGAPLPPDFMELLRLDFLFGAGSAAPGGAITNPPFYVIPAFNLAEEPAFQWNQFTGPVGPLYRYRIDGNTLRIQPAGQIGGQFRMWYSPNRQDLQIDTQTFDSVNDWTDFVCLGAAIKALTKLERDPSALMMLREDVRKRINVMKKDRDSGTPRTTIDVDRGRFGGFSGSGGFGL